MDTQLYPHNQDAYKKVIEAFKTSNRTCICHPTGTGKSYIVAAVCQHFEKVLVLAPNMFVLNQQEEALKGHKSVSYMTYAWLLLHYSEIKTKYDIIVLDEFHRAGAEEWGTAVKLFLESQPQAKVLGTSATPIRYLDNEKDMAKELFDGNIASTLSIADAWHQNILPIPTYITGFYSLDGIINDLTEKIKNSKKYSKKKKEEKLLRANTIKLEWEKSSGMATILKKHLNKKTHRIIVFCSHIGNLQKMQTVTKQWLRSAGLRISGSYMIHSNQEDREKMAQMKGFYQDKGRGVKLLFAINILNEGVHIPNVDAVLMLRTTSSKIIYLQQLGRCLTSANSNNPIVLDMVDNISTTSVSFIQEMFDKVKKEDEKKEHQDKENKKKNAHKFEIFDYTLNVKQMIEKLSPAVIPLDTRIEMATKFCEKYGRAPSKNSAKERDDYLNWRAVGSFIDRNSMALDLYVKYGTNSIRSVFRQRFINFINEHKRLPRGYGGDNSETNLYGMFAKNKEEILKDPEIKKLYDECIEAKKKASKVEYHYNIVIDFCKVHNRLPSRTNPEDKNAYHSYRCLKNRCYKEQRYKDIISKYSKIKKLDRIIDDVCKYTEEHGYLPCHRKDPLYKSWKGIKSRHPDNPRIQELIAKYKEATRQEFIRIVSENLSIV